VSQNGNTPHCVSVSQRQFYGARTYPYQLHLAKHGLDFIPIMQLHDTFHIHTVPALFSIISNYVELELGIHFS